MAFRKLRSPKYVFRIAEHGAQACLFTNAGSVKDLDIAIRKVVAAVGPQESGFAE